MSKKEVGSSGWTRTSNPPVNSRMLCQLRYRGTVRFPVAIPVTDLDKLSPTSVAVPGVVVTANRGRPPWGVRMLGLHMRRDHAQRRNAPDLATSGCGFPVPPGSPIREPRTVRCGLTESCIGTLPVLLTGSGDEFEEVSCAGAISR